MSTNINRYERERERTRTAFMDAAIDLVIRQGYKDTTVTQIADAADYGRGTFYLYFEDKADVVWCALERYFTQWHDAAYEEISHITSLRREYLSWVAVFRNLQDYWYAYAQIDLVDGAAVWEKMRGYLINSYEENLREGRYRAEMNFDVTMMARFLYGAMNETMRWWVETGFEQTPEALAEMVFQMVYRQPVPEE